MWIDEYTIISLLLIWFFGWVIYRSPILTWVFMLLLMLWVCFFAVSAAAFVTFAVHIPKGHYGVAIVSMMLGIFLSAIPTLITWDHLKRHLSALHVSLKPWE